MYDCAIVGGGLAGLSLAVQLLKQNHTIILFEQKTYPFHRVCGEYISMESWAFLKDIGLELEAYNLPKINRLMVSAPNGYALEQKMIPGGFGLSRYTLDHLLYQLVKGLGGEVLTHCRVQHIHFDNQTFSIQSTRGVFRARQACGAFGKFSNLDSQLRPQTLPYKLSQPTFVGVKYHINLRFPSNLIALHNFEGGYCGISEIEEGKNCLCYMVKASLLKAYRGQIKEMEEELLFQNPYLKDIFKHATFLFEKPEVISQINFNKRSVVEEHILLLGDAAGVIPPLCGNGMSMALRSSQILAGLIDLFLQHKISRNELEQQYTIIWQENFSLRVRTGRVLQHIFGHKKPVEIFLKTIKNLPSISELLINLTHGKPF